jgi:hypothetical protein
MRARKSRSAGRSSGDAASGSAAAGKVHRRWSVSPATYSVSAATGQAQRGAAPTRLAAAARTRSATVRRREDGMEEKMRRPAGAGEPSVADGTARGYLCA